MYELTSNVNGKPSYAQSDWPYENAIWFNKENSLWVIGSKYDIGSDSGRFSTKNEFGGLTESRNKWNDGHKTLGPNEINVQCLLEGKLDTTGDPRTMQIQILRSPI